MTKRDYITIFLEKVKEIWEPARGFLVLIRYNILNEEQTEDLFQVFKSVVQSSSDEMKKRKLQRAILAVENLRNQEKTETTLNQDLDQILSEI